MAFKRAQGEIAIRGAADYFEFSAALVNLPAGEVLDIQPNLHGGQVGRGHIPNDRRARPDGIGGRAARPVRSTSSSPRARRSHL